VSPSLSFASASREHVLCVAYRERAADGSRLIGFEELGDTDQFTASMLEFRLKQSGMSYSSP